jgi:hypothetical protein
MSQLVVTDDYGTTLLVHTTSELRAVLTELAASPRAQAPTIYMTMGADELIVGVRGDRGVLYWQCNGSDDAVATGGSNSGPVMYGANEIRMPAGTELPLRTVLDAAHEFAVTGRRPENVVWINYRDASRDSAVATAYASQQTVAPDRSRQGIIRDAVFDLYADNPDLPMFPVDGDCLTWTPHVVAALRDKGFSAEPTTITGWITWQSTNVISFMHRAAVVDGDTIVDVTARQFTSSLPLLWVAHTEDYCAELATATGVAQVTVGQLGISADAT